eukprot:4822616-Pyramimonas_sp.AAC.1
MEHSCQIEGRLLTGREMIRAICVRCSVRSESGQHWICRDLFKLTTDRHKPKQDLHHFYSEWMERHQEFYGAKESSDEMKASIHAHFYKQIRQVPRLEYAMQWYELSTDPPGTGMRTYQWLLLQVESLLMRDREQWAISEHESTLSSRNRGPPDRWDERGWWGRTKSLCHGVNSPSIRIAFG